MRFYYASHLLSLSGEFQCPRGLGIGVRHGDDGSSPMVRGYVVISADGLRRRERGDVGVFLLDF